MNSRHLKTFVALLLLWLPAPALAALTFGAAPGTGSLVASEQQAKAFAAALEKQLGETVHVVLFADEATLHSRMNRYQQIDIAIFSQGYVQQQKSGEFFQLKGTAPLGAADPVVLRQGMPQRLLPKIQAAVAAVASAPQTRTIFQPEVAPATPAAPSSRTQPLPSPTPASAPEPPEPTVEAAAKDSDQPRIWLPPATSPTQEADTPAAPSPAPPPTTTDTAADEGTDWLSYVLYGLAATCVAGVLLAAALMRGSRRPKPMARSNRDPGALGAATRKAEKVDPATEAATITPPVTLRPTPRDETPLATPVASPATAVSADGIYEDSATLAADPFAFEWNQVAADETGGEAPTSATEAESLPAENALEPFAGNIPALDQESIAAGETEDEPLAFQHAAPFAEEIPLAGPDLDEHLAEAPATIDPTATVWEDSALGTATDEAPEMSAESEDLAAAVGAEIGELAAAESESESESESEPSLPASSFGDLDTESLNAGPPPTTDFPQEEEEGEELTSAVATELPPEFTAEVAPDSAFDSDPLEVSPSAHRLERAPQTAPTDQDARPEPLDTAVSGTDPTRETDFPWEEVSTEAQPPAAGTAPEAIEPWPVAAGDFFAESSAAATAVVAAASGLPDFDAENFQQQAEAIPLPALPHFFMEDEPEADFERAPNQPLPCAEIPDFSTFFQAPPEVSSTPPSPADSDVDPTPSSPVAPRSLRMKGELGASQVPALLKLIAGQRRPGTLVVHTALDEKRIFFREGKIAGASAFNRSKNAETGFLMSKLGYLLVRQGFITEPERDHALEICQRQPDRRLGEVLMEISALTHEKLKSTLRMQVEEIIHSLILFPHGRFEYVTENSPISAADDLGIDVGALLREAGRQAPEWRELRKAIPSLNTVMEHQEKSRQRLQNARMNPHQQMVLSLVDGNRTVREICARASMLELEVYKFLALMVKARVIRPQSTPLPSDAGRP